MGYELIVIVGWVGGSVLGMLAGEGRFVALGTGGDVGAGFSNVVGIADYDLGLFCPI